MYTTAKIGGYMLWEEKAGLEKRTCFKLTLRRPILAHSVTSQAKKKNASRCSCEAICLKCFKMYDDNKLCSNCNFMSYD